MTGWKIENCLAKAIVVAMFVCNMGYVIYVYIRFRNIYFFSFDFLFV